MGSRAEFLVSLIAECFVWQQTYEKTDAETIAEIKKVIKFSDVAGRIMDEEGAA